MHSPEQLELERSGQQTRLIEAVKVGVEWYRQQVYGDFLSEINALSDTRAGAQLNPHGRVYFGKDHGNSIYLRRRGTETPTLIIERTPPPNLNIETIETIYCVEPESDEDTQLKSYKMETFYYQDDKRYTYPFEKFSIREGRRLTSLMRKMNQNYKSATHNKRFGSFLED